MRLQRLLQDRDRLDELAHPVVERPCNRVEDPGPVAAREPLCLGPQVFDVVPVVLRPQVEAPQGGARARVLVPALDQGLVLLGGGDGVVERDLAQPGRLVPRDTPEATVRKGLRYQLQGLGQVLLVPARAVHVLEAPQRLAAGRILLARALQRVERPGLVVQLRVQDLCLLHVELRPRGLVLHTSQLGVDQLEVAGPVPLVQHAPPERAHGRDQVRVAGQGLLVVGRGLLHVVEVPLEQPADREAEERGPGIVTSRVDLGAELPYGRIAEVAGEHLRGVRRLVGMDSDLRLVRHG